MPRTRRLLADQGTTMTQGLAPTPICAPARASLLTGQYAHNHGVLTVEGEAGGVGRVRRPAHAADLAAHGRLRHDVRRQVPQRLRHREPALRPAGLEPSGGAASTSRRTRSSGRSSTSTARSSSRRATAPTSWPATPRRCSPSTGTGRRRGHPFFLWVNYVAPHHGGPDESDDPKRVWPGGRTLATTRRRRATATRSATSALPQGPAMWEQDLRGNPHAGTRAAAGLPGRRARGLPAAARVPAGRRPRRSGGPCAALRRVRRARPDRHRADLRQRLHGRPAQPRRQAVVLRRVGAHPDHPARPRDPPRQAALDPDHQPRPGGHDRRASPGRGRPARSTGST